MKSVSILGSCVSRDIFNRKFISNYREYFNLKSYGHQPSIISIMSSPIPYKEDDLIGKGKSVLDRPHFKSELEKNYLTTLQINQPDLLILDFYSDVMYGASSNDKSFV